MMKIIQKIKNYHPNKYIWYLYFFIPIFIGIITRVDKEADIFFLLRYGEQVIHHGFPMTDFLSMHQNFSFVMQQWLSSVIFYLFYHFFGHYGLIIIVNFVNILILFALYKYCMLLSNGNYKVSILISCITDLLLETFFILPRPQIFDFLILLLVLYIMEIFFQKKSSKVLLWLPLLSFLQINLHSSTWFMLYLFMLPYLVSLGYEKIIDPKDRRIYQVLGIIIIMFLVGVINPYGIKNILYVFTSYGNIYINRMVIEMLPVALSSKNSHISLFVYFIMTCVFAIYIGYKKEKISLRYSLLLIGVSLLAIMHLRNLSLYFVGAIPPLALYLKNVWKPTKAEKSFQMGEKYKRHYQIIIVFLVFYTILAGIVVNRKFTHEVEKGANYLLEHQKKEDIILYANYNSGSYLEFRGLKPYIDGRAEIFLKSNNKKEDILKEYYLLSNGYLDYKKFVDKYHFTHLIVSKKENLYRYISKNKSYRKIFEEKNYAIYEKR